MTSTPITVRLKDDIPSVTPAGQSLSQALPQTILDDAERIYKGERENKVREKNNKLNEHGLGIRTDSQGKTRPAGSLMFDPFNLFGVRSKAIESILSDTNRREALMEGPDSNGKYRNLNWVDRYIHKITDEDITKGLHKREIRRLRNDKTFQADLKDLTPEQRAKVTSLTPEDTVRELAEDEREYEALVKKVRGMDLGAYSLDELIKRNDGKRISLQDLEQLETDLKPLQQEAITKARLNESQLATEATNRDVSERNAAVSERGAAVNERTAAVAEGKLDLLQTQEANNNAIRRAEIDYNNAKLQQDTDIANAKLKYEYETGNFDRELKRDLALLGLDDKREERQYRSERDRAQERQLFIIQLMKGLGGLGQSFGGY